jgi:hypothetical protein
MMDPNIQVEHELHDVPRSFNTAVQIQSGCAGALKWFQLDFDIVRPNEPLFVKIPLFTRIFKLDLLRG